MRSDGGFRDLPFPREARKVRVARSIVPADACETLFARHTARLYLERSMFPNNARDNLILDGRIPGLLLIVVVVVVTEATAP